MDRINKKAKNYTNLCEGSRGRVVKAMDLKSIGVSPRRFESCRLRYCFITLWRLLLLLPVLLSGCARFCPYVDILLGLQISLPSSR